jgi:hypothetical protein
MICKVGQHRLQHDVDAVGQPRRVSPIRRGTQLLQVMYQLLI